MGHNLCLCPHEMAQFLHDLRQSQCPHAAGTRSDNRRWVYVMDHDSGFFGLIVGGIVAIAAAIFILGGGDFGGKKTVEGDRDLPPIASTDK